MNKKELVAEITRQLKQKSEITSVGPPYVILKGEEVLVALGVAEEKRPFFDPWFEKRYGCTLIDARECHKIEFNWADVVDAFNAGRDSNAAVPLPPAMPANSSGIAKGMRAAAQIADNVADKKLQAAQRARDAGHPGVANHRESDAQTALEISLAIEQAARGVK